MAMSSDEQTDRASTDDGEPLTRDDRVKLDLDFEEALRALLGTPPPENGEGEAEKQPGSPTRRTP